MKITRIKKVKRRNKYKLFIDNKYAFSLSKKALDKFCLEENQEFDSEELKYLREKIEFFEGEKALVHFLKYRFRSEKEMRRKLKLKKISNKVCERLIDKFKDYGYINDERFAENYLSDLLHHHPQGEYFIKKKLYQKGIDSNIIDKLFAKYVTKDKIQDMSDRLLKKKERSLQRYDIKKRKEKSLTYLQRKGFPYQVAKTSYDKIIEKE